jgi:hypothetical protein
VLERWPLEITAGEASIVISLRELDPIPMGLAFDIRAADLTLGFQRIQLKGPPGPSSSFGCKSRSASESCSRRMY